MAALVAATACAPVSTPISSSAPEARPDPVKVVQPYQPSAASVALAKHYQRVEGDLIVQGLLRQDGGGPDVPFNARQLTDNFIRIALYDEYIQRAGVLIAEATQRQLVRWTKPVRVTLHFGPSVSETQRKTDRRQTLAYLRRLSRVTGHPISLVETGANFHVLVMDEDERVAFTPKIPSLFPGIDKPALDQIRNMPRETFCTVFSSYTEVARPSFTTAIAVIRAEHPTRLRQSCLHEEIAQGLGLFNDSPAARPSIFNDDEEFGLLTTHDEMLLRVLYDPRLKPGMTEEDARPIVTRIAAEILGDS